jgi:hypothetical protein
MIPINAHINQHILWHKIYKTCSNEIAFIILENLFRHEIKTKLSCRFDLYLWNHNSFVAHASTPCKTSVPWSINIHVENVQALLIWYMHLWPKRFKCSKDLPNVEITSIHQIHKPPLPNLSYPPIRYLQWKFCEQNKSCIFELFGTQNWEI